MSLGLRAVSDAPLHSRGDKAEEAFPLERRNEP